MREIKFRAKDVFTSKWVYGDLVHNKKVTKTGLEDRIMVGGYEVSTETICQYTGLQDMKGNPIYEGDILRVHYGKSSKGEEIYFDKPVIWHDKFASFLLKEDYNSYSPIPVEYSEVVGDGFNDDKL